MTVQLSEREYIWESALADLLTLPEFQDATCHERTENDTFVSMYITCPVRSLLTGLVITDKSMHTTLYLWKDDDVPFTIIGIYHGEQQKFSNLTHHACYWYIREQWWTSTKSSAYPY